MDRKRLQFSCLTSWKHLLLGSCPFDANQLRINILCVFFCFLFMSQRNLFANFSVTKSNELHQNRRIAYSVPLKKKMQWFVCFMMSIIPRSNTSWAAMWKECIGVMEGVFAPQSIKSYRSNYNNFHRIHIALLQRSEQKNAGRLHFLRLLLSVEKHWYMKRIALELLHPIHFSLQCQYKI